MESIVATQKIYTSKKAYSSKQKMTRIFLKLSNKLVEVFRRCLASTSADAAKSLWEAESNTVAETLILCVRVLAVYRNRYANFRDAVIVNSGNRNGIKEDVIFYKTDIFCEQARNVLNCILMSQRFNAMVNCFLTDAKRPAEIFRQARTKLVLACPDPFQIPLPDSYQCSHAKFEALSLESESILHKVISTSVHSCSVVQLRSWYNSVHSSLKSGRHSSFIDSFNEKISKRVTQEVKSLASIYERFKERPPQARDAPQVCISIAWSQCIRKRLKGLVSFLELPKSADDDAVEVVVLRDGTHRKLQLALGDFEKRWYDAWVLSAISAMPRLDDTILVRGSYQCFKLNLSPLIGKTVLEAKTLARMGVGIPVNVQLLAARELTLKRSHANLVSSLGLVRDIRKRCKPLLIDLVLSTEASQALEASLGRGCSSVKWADLTLEDYSKQLMWDAETLGNLETKCSAALLGIYQTLAQMCRHRIKPLPDGIFEDIDKFVQAQQGSIQSSIQFLSKKVQNIQVAVDEIASITAPAYSSDVMGKETLFAKFKLEIHHLVQATVLYIVRVALKSLISDLRSAKNGREAIERNPRKPLFSLELKISPQVMRVWPPLDKVKFAFSRLCKTLITCFTDSVNEVDFDSISISNNQAILSEVLRTCLLVKTALDRAEENMRTFIKQRINVFDWIWQEPVENGCADNIVESSLSVPHSNIGDVRVVINQVPNKVVFYPFVVVTSTVKNQLLDEYSGFVGGGGEYDLLNISQNHACQLT